MDFARMINNHARAVHPQTVNEFVRQLTEGRVPWGAVDVSPASRGLWQRVRLTVYPPGTSPAERRILHFAHSWPVTGAIAGLFAIVALAGEPPILGLIVTLVVYLGGFWTSARLAHDLRARSRTITVVSVHAAGEPEEFGNGHLLRAVSAQLDDMEAGRRAGRLDPVQYEAAWSAVYETLPSENPARVAR